MSNSLSAAMPHLLFLFCEHMNPYRTFTEVIRKNHFNLEIFFSNTGVLPVRELHVVITVMTEMTIRTAQLEDLSWHMVSGGL